MAIYMLFHLFDKCLYYAYKTKIFHSVFN